MKKITFILLALISGTAFAQNSAKATGTAQVNAEIVSPIKIENGTALDFGRIIGNSAGGDVVIATNGTRTSTNDDLLDPTNEGSAGSFDVTAAEGYAYSITINDIVLSGAGDDMDVTFDNNLGESSTGTGSTQDLNLGGTLTVNASQAEGDYTGTVTVTVAYE